MDVKTVQDLLRQAEAGLRLLDHPFYLRWQRGQLAAGELAAYAAQYRHFEQLVPVVLSAAAAGVDDDRAAELIGRNLADEAGGDPTHLQLFDRFAVAVAAEVGGAAVGAPAEGGGAPAEADEATAGLVGTYLELAAAGPALGLTALAAYEHQAADVAATKASGLRAHYGFDGGAVTFWDVHAELDADHARWAAEAISRLPVEAGQLYDAARQANQAWWSFLDQREACATAG